MWSVSRTNEETISCEVFILFPVSFLNKTIKREIIKSKIKNKIMIKTMFLEFLLDIFFI